MNIASATPLSQGGEIPWLGFGVFQVDPGQSTYKSVREALRVGYRHIDTAAYYQNEADVGRAIRDSGVPRSEIFVTSKVWNDDDGYDKTIRAFEKTMEEIALDELDLFLVHWPVTDLVIETWEALVSLHREGRVKAIGVSNFEPHHLDEVIEATGVVPVVNQVELHPYLNQQAVRKACRERGIVVEAWSPIARGGVVADETLRAIGAAHGKSAVQVTLRWHLQNGVVILPRSITPSRIRENSELFDFALSDEEMAIIDALDREESGRIGPHPDTFA